MRDAFTLGCRATGGMSAGPSEIRGTPEGDSCMISRTPVWRSVALVAVASLALAACGGSSGGTASGNGGGGGKTLVISSDLPLQGASKDASAAMNNAIKLYLDQVDHKAGKFTIDFKPYDDSTAAKG